MLPSFAVVAVPVLPLLVGARLLPVWSCDRRVVVCCEKCMVAAAVAVVLALLSIFEGIRDWSCKRGRVFLGKEESSRVTLDS
jgi:hypothetical protein